MSTDKVIQAIRDQTDTSPPDLVFVIEVVSIKFDTFTPELVNQLQKYENLQSLTLNDCGIKSLNNFPRLPGLIRLDMVFNEIKGEDLIHLRNSRHLQTLMLGGNKVEQIDHLKGLSNMKKIFQLDFINNPIQKQPGYRVKVFQMFPSLMILDTLDKSGKDAYNNTNMVQTVSRVPDNLFDKSPIIPVSKPIFPVVNNSLFGKSNFTFGTNNNIFGNIPPVMKSNIINNNKPPKLDKTSSKNSINILTKSRTSKQAKGKLISNTSHTRSSKAGLTFPVTRIKRHLHGVMIDNRISVGSAVYMAAVLQYLTAQLVEIAGNVAKNNKKVRITPRMIQQAIKNDEQMNKLLNSVTIPRQE